MASVEELANLISGNRDAIEQAQNSIESSKAGADELMGEFQSLGVNDKSEQVSQIKTGLEELQTALQGMKDAAENLQTQTLGLSG